MKKEPENVFPSEVSQPNIWTVDNANDIAEKVTIT